MELATDPIIDWIEFQPGVGRVVGLTTVGDGRVLASPARITAEKNGVTIESAVTRIVTTDGVHWDELPLPESIHPGIVDISGDPWLVTGRDRDEQRDSVPHTPEPVFVSSDRGLSWSEVPVDSEPPVPHSFDQHLQASSALASDGRIVVSSEIYTHLDLGALLRDRGLISESQDAFVFSVSDDDRVTAAVIEGDDRDLVEFTVEELSLTPDQLQVLKRPPPVPDPVTWGVRVYSGDETGLEATAEYAGYVNEGFVTSGGFVLHVERPYGLDPQHLLVASPDGRAWSERSLDVDGEDVDGVEAAGDRLALLISNVKRAYSRIRILCHDGSPLRDVTLQGVSLSRDLPVGPAGFVALVRPLHSFTNLFDSVSFYGGAVARGSVTKDVYELRVNEPEPGITLWNLEEDQEIYASGRDLAVGRTPDGVRQSGAGEEFTVTFEDPANGSDLVTFTWDDLGTIFRSANFPRGDTWVGWSADGTEWEWQDAAAVFGTSNVDLAVGSDFLLAHTQGEPFRWFIADVPAG
ncbi:MAG: hypothetical protein OXG40_08730 [Acidimicrobiaceae bacterium]|nr:hypothetical protein [Acidimicrobiaceae bacterium]